MSKCHIVGNPMSLLTFEMDKKISIRKAEFKKKSTWEVHWPVNSLPTSVVY